jgi:hypothetical protein
MFRRPRGILAVAILLLLAQGTSSRAPFAAGSGRDASEGGSKEFEEERLDQPPGKPAADDRFARTPGLRVWFEPYVSIQVNIDPLGSNIFGDAANEPSIAVNPTNPANMVIGWRQFDTIASNFRQAGWAYTFDGGQHWTFPGVLEPGVFRSDPSLDADSHGTFFYQSLKGNLRADVFRSTNGGVTWLPAVPEFGGDKNWLAIDRTGGASDGFLYGIWQRFGGACCGANTFTRSTNAGASFQTPVPVSFFPVFGTMTVGPSGEVYATGIDGTVGQDTDHYVVAKSTTAKNPAVTPTFTGTRVDLGGSMEIGAGPNPGGLLGQPNVFVNRAPGPRHGHVYVLGSVVAPGGVDPMDVHIISSANGGSLWSIPMRVNDDSLDGWQWMAAGAVSPNGRIDAVWNDTRNSSALNVSQLFYAYSWDGGDTWSPNVPVSPLFDSSLGYPQQSKMGDYSTVVSDPTGADVAYTATFNGEQDIYYLRVFPDCNGNAISDVTDLANGIGVDCDANHIPDQCQIGPPDCLGAGSASDGAAGAQLTVAKAVGDSLALAWGASCRSGDDDYAVYEGTLGSFYSHAARACTTAGATAATIASAAGNTYYLVVPTRAYREGSYGKSSAGAERPSGSGTCFPQLVKPCDGP